MARARYFKEGGAVVREWVLDAAQGQKAFAIPVFDLPVGGLHRLVLDVTTPCNGASAPYEAVLLVRERYKAVSTFAGQEASGAVSGNGATAQFNNPTSLALAASGDLNVADSQNNMIRRIDGAGNVTTVSGDPVLGFTDSASGSPRFSRPLDIKFDGAGNLFIADSTNHAIRKLAPGGTVTTIAGGRDIGYLDGPAAGALFRQPTGVAVDADGVVYVADSSNNRVRKISGGVVSTLAGDGSNQDSDGVGTAAKLDVPIGLALDGKGGLYVSTGGGRIRRIDLATKGVTTYAGAGQGNSDGTGVNARFGLPIRIALDASGSLYVADQTNATIRKIFPGGVVVTVAGTTPNKTADGAAGSAGFTQPRGIAVDPAGDRIWVGEGRNVIRRIQ